MGNQVQEAQRTLGKINTEKITTTYFIIKMLKVKDKEKIQKEAKKNDSSHQENPSTIIPPYS